MGGGMMDGGGNMMGPGGNMGPPGNNMVSKENMLLSSSSNNLFRPQFIHYRHFYPLSTVVLLQRVSFELANYCVILSYGK